MDLKSELFIKRYVFVIVIVIRRYLNTTSVEFRYEIQTSRLL